MSHSNSDSYNNRIQQPNFTQIPNVVMDYWMHVLDHCTSCVLIFLCRKTLGWQKKRDCLSLKKIEIGLNMSRNRVIKSLKILEEHGLIRKEEHFNEFGDQDPNTYEVIIHEVVVHEVNHPVHAMNHGGSAREELGVVHGVNPQKKDIQNKNNTSKEDIASTTASRRYEITFSIENRSFKGIDQRDIDSWRDLYPTADVSEEIKRMVEWCIANPKKTKSKKRWRTFINNWLKSTNDKNINRDAYAAANSQNNKKSSKEPQIQEEGWKVNGVK